MNALQGSVDGVKWSNNLEQENVGKEVARAGAACEETWHDERVGR